MRFGRYNTKVIEIFNFKIDLWTVWGLAAQGLFFLSFVVQWYKSERIKKSFIPMEFWVMRMVATAMMLFYVYQRKDVVFLLSSFLQMIIYSRNIWLIKNTDEQK